MTRVARTGDSSFATWQPRYAEHGIAAIPLRPIVDVKKKVPYIEKGQLLQLPESAKLIQKFPHARVAFWAGKRNRISVLDVDSKSENDLADAMTRFSASPFIVRTAAKGGFHAYYRHNGEKHGIKPEEGKPWDILTNSLVVAAPTACIATGGSYQIIEGKLDDLDDLPVMCDAPKVPDGRRNRELWMHCMRQAPYCDTLDDLVDVANTYYRNNCDHDPPMDDKEIKKTATSAWKCTEAGLNRIGRRGAWLPVEDVNRLMKEGQAAQDWLLLTSYFRANEGPEATFFIANGMAKMFGWTRKRFAAARKAMVVSGLISRVAAPSSAPSKGPHWFRWRSGGQF